MAMTVIVEVGLAIFTLLAREKNLTTRLGVIILIALATFQLAEYGICEDLGLNDNLWAKAGFVAITTLPVLGFHMIHTIAGKTNKYAVGAGYLTGLAWIILFLSGNAMENSVCNGNYVIFNLREGFGGAYFIFYYFWLIYGSVVAIHYARLAQQKTKKALWTVVLGYASFTVPATLIWFFASDNGASQGLPSIMCGFAVIFAVLLTTIVLPNSSEKLQK